MQEVLDDLRKINAVLQTENLWTLDEDSDLPFTPLSEALGELLKIDLFIVSIDGRVLGVHDHFKVNNERMNEYVINRQFPEFYMRALIPIEHTLENLSVDEELTIFPVEVKENYRSGKTTIIPIYASGQKLGYVIMGRVELPFSTANLILAEHAATVIGTELLHWSTKRTEKEKRERDKVRLAIKSLSFSEVQAMKVILSLFEDLELKFTALKVAEEYKLTRTVIVNAIRKLESAGVIESRSLGTKGTYIKIKSKTIFDALQREIHFF